MHFRRFALGLCLALAGAVSASAQFTADQVPKATKLRGASQIVIRNDKTAITVTGRLDGDLTLLAKIRAMPSYSFSSVDHVMYEPVRLSELDLESFQQQHPYGEHIVAAARRYEVDPRLIVAVIKQESNFKPKAVSRAGAKGMMQLMPATARILSVKDVFDPAQNILGGTRYLSELLQSFRNDLTLALAAYNAGPGTVMRYGNVPPYAETQEYVRRVAAHWTDARWNYLR